MFLSVLIKSVRFTKKGQTNDTVKLFLKTEINSLKKQYCKNLE